MKLKEYPGNSWENECELSNTTLTWEELQSKLEAAANAFEEITNSDGTINGYYVYGVTSDGVVVIETSIGEDGSTTTTTTSLTNSLTTISGNIVTVNGELDAVSARIGTVETTYLSATEAELIYATIKELDAANANISRLDTKYANIASAIIGEAAVNKLIAGEAEIDYADITGLMAKYAQIDLANVEVESVGTLFANVGVLTDVTIVNGHITGTLSGVTIYGDCIVANTIVADSLVLQGADGLYYAINATSESLTSSQLTDEKYQNYIDGSVIVAKSITADQIAAGTITANEINVLNLFAQDITATGTITGLTLEGGSINIGDGMFTVDSSGKMVAKSGSFSGDVGATSFSLDDVSMYVDTIMASIDDRIVELINSYPALDYEVTVAGYGSPDDVGLSASDYTGQYYIDAIIGETGEVYIYYSNGTTWKLYDTLYATIAGDSLDEIISQIQEVVQENLIQIFVVDAENGMRVDGYFEATNGKIGDWTLDSALYSGLSSIDGTDVGTYIGIDGIRQYGSSGDYIDIRDGVLSINGVDISIGSKTISFTGVTADGEGAATLYTRDVLIIDTSSGMYVNGVAHLDESVLVQTNINYGSFDYLFGGTLSAGTITGNKLSLKSTLDVTGAATFNSSVSIPISNVTIGSSSRTTDCSLMMRNSDNYMSIYLKSGGMGIYDNTLSCDVLYHASTGALTVGNTTYATTVKGSTITLSGATTVSGNLTANSSVAVPSSNITVGSSSRTTNSQVVVQTSNGTGCLYLNADGSFGLWSNTKSIGVVGISSSGAWTAGSTSYQTTLSGYGVYLTSSSGYSAIFTSEGNFRLNSDAVGNLGTSGYRWKNVYASNSSIQTSDANEKTNIVDIDERYEQLFMLLRGVNYMWRNYRPNDNHDRVHCGLIAQEVETACAEVGLDSTTFAALCWDQLETPTYDGRTVRYSLAYGELHGLEIHMIQKCVNNISDHESRITELETKLSDANATIASLTKQLNELQASAA
ncbi:MAG: tail fiber domain-containing protein [Clostridiales bacterium]|nr:tail fiber domain-containing protein [Clostridiales bacterium]